MVIPNLKFFFNELKKLRYYQRAHSRTKKGSKNREKARRNLARQHARVRNLRKDYLHKITTMLVNNLIKLWPQLYDIVIEDLSVQNMMKNRKLSRAIADVGWYMFRTFLQYKCDWYGKHLVIIGKFEPTSKMCSSCKAKQDMPLNVRTYRCRSCGLEIDRDFNASKNIRAAGISVLNTACGEMALATR
jgi:putative transposase